MGNISENTGKASEQEKVGLGGNRIAAGCIAALLAPVIILTVLVGVIVPVLIKVIAEDIFEYQDPVELVEDSQRELYQSVVNQIDTGQIFYEGGQGRADLGLYLQEWYDGAASDIWEGIQADIMAYGGEELLAHYSIRQTDLSDTLYMTGFADYCGRLVNAYGSADDLLMFQFPDQGTVTVASGYAISNSAALREQAVIHCIKQSAYDGLEINQTEILQADLVKYTMVEVVVDVVDTVDMTEEEAKQYLDEGYVWRSGDMDNLYLLDEVSMETSRVTGQEWEADGWDAILPLLDAGYEVDTDTLVHITELSVGITGFSRLPDITATEKSYIRVDNEGSLGILQQLMELGDASVGLSTAEKKQALLSEFVWTQLVTERYASDSLDTDSGAGTGSSGGSSYSLPQSEWETIFLSWDTYWIGLSESRKDVISFALASVGRIPYVWGGSASGPGYTGIHSGLDCSHWVDWVFWSVMDDNLGNGSTATLSGGGCAYQITEGELRPGDLAFKYIGGSSSINDSNHVAIFIGYDENHNRIYVHQNSSSTGIIVSTQPQMAYYFRPNCFGD